MDVSLASTGLAKESFVGIGVAFVGLSALFVAIRLVVNIKKSKTLLVEDVASLVALALLATSLVLHVEIVSATFSKQKPFLGLIVAFNVVVSLAMWSSKTPILLLYIRLFGKPNTWLRVVSYIAILSTFVAFLIGICVVGAGCSPGRHATSVDLLDACTAQANKVAFGLGFVALATDVVILALPLPVLVALRLPNREKVGLFVVFLAGTFAVIAGGTSSYFKWLSTSHKTSSNMRAAMLCRIVESCIAIIAGCVPATYAFWKTYVSKSPRFQRLSMAFARPVPAPMVERPSYWDLKTANGVEYEGRGYPGDFDTLK
ncbi:hypothetical protein OQA88_5516 [Cercophora sp. LCS_1]